MKIKIFNIQRMSLHDGPGVRTTVFFAGCNMRCKWCHNPESYAQTNLKNSLKNKNHNTINEFGVNEVLTLAKKDKIMYDISSGGVTCSGGEPLLQIEALKELLQKLKKENIHTAVDTAGHVPFHMLEQIVPYTDVFLYDIKHWNNSIHQRYTGVTNDLILNNFNKLEKIAKIIVRIPIIDTIQNYEYKPFVEILKEKKNLDVVELLPYHKLGKHKYEYLGKEIPKFEPPTYDDLQEIKTYFEKYDISTKIYGGSISSCTFN